MADFHERRRDRRDWEFTREETIAFLRSKRDAGMPAWKRMKIIDGLIHYRCFVQQRDTTFLLELRAQMKEIVLVERVRDGGYDSIEEAVGHINPKESDAVQEFRRAMRRAGFLRARTQGPDRYSDS